MRVVTSLGKLSEGEQSELQRIFNIYNLESLSNHFIDKGISINTVVCIGWSLKQLNSLGISVAASMQTIVLGNLDRMVTELRDYKKLTRITEISKIDKYVGYKNYINGKFNNNNNDGFHFNNIISNNTNTNLQTSTLLKEICDYINGKITSQQFRGDAYFIRPRTLYIGYCIIGNVEYKFCGCCVIQKFKGNRGISPHARTCEGFITFMNELHSKGYKIINGNKWSIRRDEVNQNIKPLLCISNIFVFIKYFDIF